MLSHWLGSAVEKSQDLSVQLAVLRLNSVKFVLQRLALKVVKRHLFEQHQGLVNAHHVVLEPSQLHQTLNSCASSFLSFQVEVPLELSNLLQARLVAHLTVAALNFCPVNLAEGLLDSRQVVLRKEVKFLNNGFISTSQSLYQQESEGLH